MLKHFIGFLPKVLFLWGKSFSGGGEMEAQGFVCNPALFDVTDLERATRGHFQVWRSCFFLGGRSLFICQKVSCLFCIPGIQGHFCLLWTGSSSLAYLIFLCRGVL